MIFDLINFQSAFGIFLCSVLLVCQWHARLASLASYSQNLSYTFYNVLWVGLMPNEGKVCEAYWIKILNFNYWILYSGALHLCPQLPTMIYKYYGAPHLWGFTTIKSMHIWWRSEPLGLHYNQVSANMMTFRTFRSDTKRQSRIIFVEMHLKYITIGAEHRNI